MIRSRTRGSAVHPAAEQRLDERWRGGPPREWIIKSFSSREHLLALTDHNYIRDLSVRRVASWAISILCDSLLRTNHLDVATTWQTRTHLEPHTRVAVALERVLSPIEHRQATVLATHLRENWDAVAPPPEKTNTDPERPD